MELRIGQTFAKAEKANEVAMNYVNEAFPPLLQHNSNFS